MFQQLFSYIPSVERLFPHLKLQFFYSFEIVLSGLETNIAQVSLFPMSDSIKASLGRRIKALRRENGLTQTKLALMINVEQSYLSKLELGSRNPSLSMLSKIADAFGITLSELFSGLPKDEGEPSNRK